MANHMINIKLTPVQAKLLKYQLTGLQKSIEEEKKEVTRPSEHAVLEEYKQTNNAILRQLM